MIKKVTLAATASLALALAACDDGAEVEDDLGVDDTAMATDDGAMADDAYPVAGDLDEEQQARLDAMDVQGTSDEYDRNMDAMRAGGSASDDAAGSSGSEAMSSDDAPSGESRASSGEARESSNEAQPLRPRGQMDFAFLDRNGDGELSVAEYAIWAVPVNPREQADNDALRPYLSAEQINEARRTFFYFDSDGDSYLSPGEFMTARNSAITP